MCLADPLLKFRLDYSYHQILVYCNDEICLSSYWEDEHVNQGFARRERVISFRTLDQFGEADCSVFQYAGEIDLNRYDRVIEVPINVGSGKLHIHGPEEVDRFFNVTSGWYLVCCAQKFIEEGELLIDLYLRHNPPLPAFSRILKADPEIRPGGHLLEDSQAL